MGRRLVTKRNLAEWEKILDVEWNYLKIKSINSHTPLYVNKAQKRRN